VVIADPRCGFGKRLVTKRLGQGTIPPAAVVMETTVVAVKGLLALLVAVTVAVYSPSAL
jgi:hypothetical protein